MAIKDDLRAAMVAYWDFSYVDLAGIGLYDRAQNFDVPFSPVGVTSRFSTVAGLYGDGGQVTGVNSGFVSESAGETFDFTGEPFMLSLWYRGGSTSAGRWVSIGSASADQWRLSVSGGNIALYVDRAGASTNIDAPISVADAWHHVVICNEPGARSCIYHDGSMVAEDSANVSTMAAFFGRIGLMGGETSNYSRQPLDEIFIARIAATDEIVDWLYNSGVGRAWGDFEAVPTPEEQFRASFEDAMGRDPLVTALIDRLDARKLACHNVKLYLNLPGFATFDLYVDSLEEREKLVPGGDSIWIESDTDPVFKGGRWVNIQGRDFHADPLKVTLLCWICDHPDSLKRPTV